MKFFTYLAALFFCHLSLAHPHPDPDATYSGNVPPGMKVTKHLRPHIERRAATFEETQQPMPIQSGLGAPILGKLGLQKPWPREAIVTNCTRWDKSRN